MKNIFAFILISTALSSYSYADCPNLSGNYQNRAGGETLLIKQKACDSLSFSYSEKAETLVVIDGGAHPISPSVFLRALFSGEALVIETLTSSTQGLKLNTTRRWQLSGSAEKVFLLETILDSRGEVVVERLFVQRSK